MQPKHASDKKEGNPLFVPEIFGLWYGYEHFTSVDQLINSVSPNNLYNICKLITGIQKLIDYIWV